MKEKYKIFIQKKLYRYLLYCFVVILLIKISIFLTQKQQSKVLGIDIKKEVFSDSSLDSKKITLTISGKTYIFLQFLKNEKVQGYGYPIEKEINGFLVKGWIMLDSFFQYKKIKIYYWQSHKNYVDLFNNISFSIPILFSLNQDIPFIWLPDVHSLLDFSNYREILEKEELLENINVLNEELFLTAYRLKSVFYAWQQTIKIPPAYTNNTKGVAL